MSQENKNIHVLYKKIGETPLSCIKRFKTAMEIQNPTLAQSSMTYAGRLDPMAEGLLIVLSGEEVYAKESYLGLTKTYEFEILWDIQTDTGDVLGVHTFNNFLIGNTAPTENEITNYFKNTLGKFEQKYPMYSSRTVLGKSLIVWSRENRIGEVEIPSHEVELFSAEYISRKNILSLELLNRIEEKINLVQGDFRQEKILKLWRELLSQNSEKMYTLDVCKISVSSGFYVRQFVSDIAKNFQTAAITYSIDRNQIGKYKRVTYI